MTGRPAARSSRALASTARVADSEIAATRGDRRRAAAAGWLTGVILPEPSGGAELFRVAAGGWWRRRGRWRGAGADGGARTAFDPGGASPYTRPLVVRPP